MSSSTMTVAPPDALQSAPQVPQKLLLGPGPSNVHKDVLEAMTMPMLGHLHPEFTKVMDDVKAGCQYIFQTKNPLTFVVSGSGHAGMECALANLLERGETALVAVTGIWGQRASDMAARLGAGKVVPVEAPLGCPVTLEQVEKALTSPEGKDAKLLFLCHGESSTGVLQPLEGFADLCRKHDCLLLVDSVAALGSTPFLMDAWGIDVAYTGSQKCLSCPPGLAPISFNERALAKIQARKAPCPSFYLDALWLGKYWGCFPAEGRVYHHTGPVSMMYALREALARIAKEKLENTIARHQKTTALLYGQLQDMALEFFVADEKHRNPAVTTIKVPDGIEWKAVTDYLMANEKIEIGGGLGPTVGKVWRIGLMGENSVPQTIERLIPALKAAIEKQLG